MKLIALRSFCNNLERKIELGKEAQHPNHIHKGAIFSIGLDKAGKDIPDFEKLDKVDQNTIRLLKIAKVIGNANAPEIVAAVQKEVAEERQREENAQARRNALTPDINLIAEMFSRVKSRAHG